MSKLKNILPTALKLIAAASLMVFAFTVGNMNSPKIVNVFSEKKLDAPIEVMGLDKPPAKMAKAFTDVKTTDWFYEDVNKLVGMGAIDGYADNTFRPDNKVTVGEFVKLLLISMGFKQDEDKDIWYRHYVEKAKELGVIDQNDNYSYNAVIRRRTMAKMVCKVLKIVPQKADKAVFADSGDMDTKWIDTVFSESLMYGYMSKGEVVFRPNMAANRAEACAVIARIIEYMKSPESFKSPKVAQNNEKRPLAARNVYAEQSKSATEIPVLLYHHILRKDENKLFKNNSMVVSAEEFENTMRLLYDNGFYTVTLFELEKFLKKEIDLPYKSVVITFDDGYLSDYIYAYPIMKRYGLVGTVFTLTSAVQRNTQKFDPDLLPMISWEDINKSTDVFNYGSHTHALHNLDKNGVSYLVGKPENEIKQDLSRSKELLGTHYFAYPYGRYTDTTITILKELGFRLAFSTLEGNVTADSNPYTLNRYTITPGRDIVPILKKAYPDLELVNR